MKQIACLAFFLLLSPVGFAGGPGNVAGVSGFNAGLVGTPIGWANGQVIYYTDQGDLSALLPNAAADQFVADAFARWTSIPTAALTATRAGSLDEDVNETSVYLLKGTLHLPADVQAASTKPVAIVFDADGRVTEALLGMGAGAPELCSTNSIYAEIDRFSEDAHNAHALVIINGNCARTSSDLPILKYRLVRALGRVLGLDYSQLNDNVVFGTPPPGVDDYAGFPVMHPLAVLCTEVNCIANADVPRMDDRAAISRLYPITAANISAFPGKTIFKDNTGRISGSVRFPAWKGIPGQGMQGVNVVARMVDPVTSRVSRSSAASSVSGFLFRGNAGNPMTGYNDILGRRLDASGSNDPALEGFFDLAGLEVPSGYSTVTYELSVESINPLYANSNAVGPYRRGPVSPSGSARAIRVTVTRGQELSQDIDMQGAASERLDQFEPETFLSPKPVPAGGDWIGSLSGYGDLDYFYVTLRGNRTFTLDVTAIDANETPTDTKAQPVVGAWGWGDPEDLPRTRESYFNSSLPATTRLQTEVISSGGYKLGIADYRGDGRPDYRYAAHLLYADDIAPVRASVKGGSTITISGIGFTRKMQVKIGAAVIAATPISPTQLAFRMPALPDAAYSVTVTDLDKNATSTIENVLYVGSVETRIVLLGGSNPQVPVGTQAPNPMRVRVVDMNTGDPVEGATVNFAVPAGASIAGCNQSVCTCITDQTGTASAYIVVKAQGASVIQASLSNGGSTSVTVNGIAAPLDIVLDHPTMYVAVGSTATLPVAATVVANGIAIPGRSISFLLNSGSANFYPQTAVTDAKGVALTAVSVSALASDVNISACVAPGNAPCRTLVVHPVNRTGFVLQRVGGDQQLVNVGESFAPLSLRVVDVNANAVSGAPVEFLVDVYRAANDTVRVVNGEVVTFTRDEPLILSTSAVTLYTDVNGMVMLPVANGENQPVQVVIQARAGQSELGLLLRTMWDSGGTVVMPSISPGGIEVPMAASGLIEPSPVSEKEQVERRHSPVRKKEIASQE